MVKVDLDLLHDQSRRPEAFPVVASSTFRRMLLQPIHSIIRRNEKAAVEEGGGGGEGSAKLGDEISDNDVELVVRRLGLVGWTWSDEASAGREARGLADGVRALLEEKKASLEELKEAFFVFDRNEDGFISPAELWCVLRRLGLHEGVRLHDCERMIRVFDADGDGRISFAEFVALMENAL